MIIHREIRSSYNHKPKVQGVDYSPFIMETVVLMETSGGGMEEPSGGDSGSVSPLRSSPAAAFCLLFLGFVFLRRLLSKLLGGLFL